MRPRLVDPGKRGLPRPVAWSLLDPGGDRRGGCEASQIQMLLRAFCGTLVRRDQAALAGDGFRATTGPEIRLARSADRGH